MDPSLTAATSEALLDRIHRFAREQALASHLRNFPADQPRLSAVANRRVSGAEHPAAARPDLVRVVADWFEARHPDWAASGRVDEMVDSEAMSALLAPGARNRKRALVVEAILAANGRRIAPTAVRAEAGWRRQDPAAASANRLVPEDDALDRHRADLVVEILTSDPEDLGALADHVHAIVDVQRI